MQINTAINSVPLFRANTGRMSATIAQITSQSIEKIYEIRCLLFIWSYVCDNFVGNDGQYSLFIVEMPKLCEHSLNLKQQKIANLISKSPLCCTGNKGHHNSDLDVCLSCGETRCLYFQKLECSYQHSYGTKHPLVYRTQNRTIYCFTCQQSLTDALQRKEEMETSNSKIDKIADFHEKVIELAKKLHERLEEKALMPVQIEKKVEKVKKEKIVKEIKQQQTQAESQHQVAKEEQQLVKHKLHLQVFGLKNLGNTCFFNSTLQCLYATEALHALYSNFTMNTQAQFGKVGQINLLFKKFLKNTQKHLNPKAIFSWVCRSKGVYKNMDQQDAQELLGVLLNGLIDGEKFWMCEDKKQFIKGRKNTITQKAFGFYLASRLQCLDCEKVSWSIDFSLQVAVSLTKSFNKKIDLPVGQVPKTEINEEGLVYPQFKESGCIIDAFFMPEYLGKDNYFTCEACKSQKAVRKFYMKDPPLVLVLTLKRFNNNLSKNNAEVKVAPSLHIEGHCLNPGKHHYQLYAMIVHSGTARGGHYTACSRRGQGWVYFSDSSFKTLPWEKVRGSQPYILFYRRSAN